MDIETEHVTEVPPLPETFNSMSAIRAAVARVDDDPENINPDDLATARGLIDNLKAAVKEAERGLDEITLAYCLKMGGFTAGNTRYWASHPSETKCVSVRETLDEAFRASGGDMDTVSTVLSVNAFKPGAAKKLLPEEAFAKCFKVVVKDNLNKELCKADTRFLR